MPKIMSRHEMNDLRWEKLSATTRDFYSHESRVYFCSAYGTRFIPSILPFNHWGSTENIEDNFSTGKLLRLSEEWSQSHLLVDISLHSLSHAISASSS
jgi:hypothetical protein